MDQRAVVLSLLLAVFGFSEECPSGWVQHVESCYHFSRDTEPWELAQMLCREFDAYLVEINSASEDNFLIMQVSSLNDRFWIGAADMIVDGEWIWMTSMTTLEYSNWNEGEPNNHAENENCAEIRGNGALWNDRRCDTSQKYICETSIEEAASVVG